MAEIGNWNGHVFEVSPTVVRSFTGLTLKGSSETEEKKSGNEIYVQRKNAKAREVSMTIMLNANFGVDVQQEATAFIDEACAGANDYFYINGKKLCACMLMLTEASIDNVQISPGGIWISCEVKLTMKQCTKDGGTTEEKSSGGSSGKSGNSKKPSVKKTDPNQILITTGWSSTSARTDEYVINSAVKKTESTIDLAQQHSASIKAKTETTNTTNVKMNLLRK